MELDAFNCYRGRIRWHNPIKPTYLSCLELGNNCSGTDQGSMSETIPSTWAYSGLTKQLRLGSPAHLLQVDIYSLPLKNCMLSLRHPACGSSLPLTAGMQATDRMMQGQHNHGTRTPHKPQTLERCSSRAKLLSYSQNSLIFFLNKDNITLSSWSELLKYSEVYWSPSWATCPPPTG